MLGFFVTVAATAGLAGAIHKGFLPQQDTGLIVGTADAPQDISFAAMARRQRAVADAVGRDPDVRAVDSSVGAGTVNPTLNSGRLYIDIGSPDHRALVRVVMDRLRRAVAGIEGITLYLQPAQDLAIETRPSRTQYQYVLQDLDEAELQLWSDRLMTAWRSEPALADVARDRQDAGLRMLTTVNRQATARMGVAMNEIDRTPYDAFGRRQIATVYSPLTQYHVIFEVDPSYRDDPAVLDRIYVTAGSTQAGTGSDAANGIPGGFHRASAPIPFSAFARVERRLAPLAITHEGLFPATTLSFNLAPGASLGQAVAARGARRSSGSACPQRWQPPGWRRGGVPGIAAERGYPGAGGAGHGLSRARGAKLGRALPINHVRGELRRLCRPGVQPRPQQRRRDAGYRLPARGPARRAGARVVLRPGGVPGDPVVRSKRQPERRRADSGKRAAHGSPGASGR